MSPRNVCFYAATTGSFKFTFKSRDKTYSKIKKTWFLLVHWVAKLMKKSRSSRSEVFCNKGLQVSSLQIYLKETPVQVFSFELCEMRTTIL